MLEKYVGYAIRACELLQEKTKKDDQENAPKQLHVSESLRLTVTGVSFKARKTLIILGLFYFYLKIN